MVHRRDAEQTLHKWSLKAYECSKFSKHTCSKEKLAKEFTCSTLLQLKVSMS